MRIEVVYKDPAYDGRAVRIKRLLSREAGILTDKIVMVDVYLFSRPLPDEKLLYTLFSDSVVQDILIDSHAAGSVVKKWAYLFEITPLAGVTDPVAITARDGLRLLMTGDYPEDLTIQTAVQYMLDCGPLTPDQLRKAGELLHNPLVQRLTSAEYSQTAGHPSLPRFYPTRIAEGIREVLEFDLASFSVDDLAEFSRKRLLALTLEEMLAVRAYYAGEKTVTGRKRLGLTPKSTDVELEIIAQTWSEHCKHKILNAAIEYNENGRSERIDSLFSEFIKSTTEQLAPSKPFLQSVFHDNAGVIALNDDCSLCFKVETHNSPSALDPYGGAITGIVGVNRDILGTGKGARPLFNTDVLCFGDPAADPGSLPRGLLHPGTVLRGVHSGIVDGGNQSGIPVVAGAIIFDESYTGKPLVFCGTGGIMPRTIDGEESWIKHIDPGDLAVMVGGRIGKDGIHGATFSSLALDEESPNSAVQIGDPITQKKMSDFLMEARDRCLYKGLTDNGAGGLSSSLGEMAEYSNGVRIHIEKCPLKYPGLAPWEIIVSESQERMSLAVSPGSIDELLELAAARDVEATVIGEFNDSGYLTVMNGSTCVAALDLEFLHHGLPQMRLKAVWKAPVRIEDSTAGHGDCADTLLQLLRDPTIASKEKWVRQYDHEVQGNSVVKPFTGIERDAPSDGAVLRPLYAGKEGIVITHGICPRIGDIDTYHMARCAVDEAFRAYIACGGDPDQASALDNFCWPDPLPGPSNQDAEYKLAQLVRACRGLREMCLEYGIPLISGKDSMKNDAVLQGRKISVRPTLLISLMGIMEDAVKAVTTDFKSSGDYIYLLGETRGEMGGTSYERISRMIFGSPPVVEGTAAMRVYRALHAAIGLGLVASCHDLADGGLGVALAESCFGGKVGITADLSMVPGNEGGGMEPWRILFCETPSRLLVSVTPDNAAHFERIMTDLPFGKIGTTRGTYRLRIVSGNHDIMDVDLKEAERAWKEF